MSAGAYINRIATAVPPNDVHQAFVHRAPGMLCGVRARQLFSRMAERSQIEHRYSVLTPSAADDRLDSDGLYVTGAFADTAKRMDMFERHAPGLAVSAVAALNLSVEEQPTHLILTTCTGLHAPGIDLEIARFLKSDGIERTAIGFMGCYAAINGLKLARHIVRSEPAAKVLMVNVELCTLHLQDSGDLEQLLCFLLFADGSAATLISAEPYGLEIVGFDATVIPGSEDQITWRVGDQGFNMGLAGTVPAIIARGLPGFVSRVQERFRINHLSLWAVHPGGRSVLDSVEQSLGLVTDALAASRRVLRLFGNMSSPTVMFVIKDLMENATGGHAGAALAFGPGLTAEMMLFRTSEGAE